MDGFKHVHEVLRTVMIDKVTVFKMGPYMHGVCKREYFSVNISG